MNTPLLSLGKRASAMVLAAALSACASGEKDGVGAGITGIDHLADHLSVQDFWVNGQGAAQAGKGGRTVCCAVLPRKWAPGLKAEIRWDIADWKSGTWSCHVRMVAVEPYDEVGQLWIHFLPDGNVRAVSSNEGPRSPTYPGPRDPIPPKQPWDRYPPPPVDPDQVCQSRTSRLVEPEPLAFIG